MLVETILAPQGYAIISAPDGERALELVAAQPHGLKGQEIPLTARIIQVVDIYDALSTARPYKPRVDTHQVFSIMRQESEQGSSDPRLTEQFISLPR